MAALGHPSRVSAHSPTQQRARNAHVVSSRVLSSPPSPHESRLSMRRSLSFSHRRVITSTVQCTIEAHSHRRSPPPVLYASRYRRKKFLLLMPRAVTGWFCKNEVSAVLLFCFSPARYKVQPVAQRFCNSFSIFCCPGCGRAFLQIETFPEPSFSDFKFGFREPSSIASAARHHHQPTLSDALRLLPDPLVQRRVVE